MRTRTLLVRCVTFAAALLVVGCGVPPRDSFQQYVARDAWDPTCAEQAMIERWTTTNPRWAVEGRVWAVDVQATFKMANECTSKLPAGLVYKQFQTVPFTATVAMASCKDAAGSAGWSLPGRESTRCWTGATLLK
ncbi:MAG: hypothetical protein FJ137_19770 [Deltaproteobacteria bacterium]|nr:hypothetical protein [Deltaproteobacteria bacterium]